MFAAADQGRVEPGHLACTYFPDVINEVPFIPERDGNGISVNAGQTEDKTVSCNQKPESTNSNQAEFGRVPDWSRPDDFVLKASHPGF
jgi:hypothetical protein